MEDLMDNTCLPCVMRGLRHVLYDRVAKGAVTFDEMNRCCFLVMCRGYDTTVGELYHFLKTHTPIHARFHERCKEMTGEECEPGTRFIRNDRLLRLLKTKQRAVEERLGVSVDELLAVDGLGGNLGNGPNFEHKNYLANLVVGPEGEPADANNDHPECRRKHVRAVRKMYAALQGHAKAADVGKYVYAILREVVRDDIKRELPPLGEELEPLAESAHEDAMHVYYETMDQKDIRDYVASLRWRERKCSEEESLKAKNEKETE